ncbi:rhomboid family intramembrane serine protease [Catenulispora subtropica]|uniref:Rhomboid family intramembrane serine protease n=1 Tax=Catenulispora subtropica TaxID=450798 RepID=A0ABN2RTF8_9ACTN
MVIPIHDKNPVSRAPVVTYGLIIANVAVFLLGPIAFAGPDPDAARKARENAYLYHYGAIPSQLLGGHGSAVWPVFTAMFVHAGWIHLLGNMLFLYVFGNNVEDRFGRIHYLVFYLLAGALSTYAFAWANPTAGGPLVGASGAIAAVLGAYAYLFPQARVTLLLPFLWFLPLRVPAWLVLGFWFVMQLPEFQQTIGVSSSSDVAYYAHVSGFVLGLLYAALVIGRGPSGPVRTRGREPAPPPLAPDYRTADPDDPYGQYHR